MILRINRPYILSIAIAGSALLGFIGWTVTAQGYEEWRQGFPITGGWSWPAVMVVNILCLGCAAGLYWKIYADAKMKIDETGVTRPSLRGPVFIKWSEVTAIKVFGGTGFYIFSGKRKVVITPYSYQSPKEVIEVITNYTDGSRYS